MCWHRNRNMDQWNRIERPEIIPHTYGQLIFNKRVKNIQWGKDSLFSKCSWESWTATCKTITLKYTLSSYSKVNSKWFKDLNIRQDPRKLPEETKGKTFFDIKSFYVINL